jgi:hypothetical protein
MDLLIFLKQYQIPLLALVLTPTDRILLQKGIDGYHFPYSTRQHHAGSNPVKQTYNELSTQCPSPSRSRNRPLFPMQAIGGLEDASNINRVVEFLLPCLLIYNF